MIKEDDWLKLDIEDDSEAISFIQKQLKENNLLIEDDAIQYVLDVIDEFSTKQEILHKAIDENEMLDYILRIIKKDDIYQISEDVLIQIIDAEYQYGLSNGTYIEE